MSGETGAGLHVVARLEGLRIGVPVGWVAEALNRCRLLPGLPRHRGAVAGLIDTDQGPLPVVELGRWLTLPTAAPAGTADAPAGAEPAGEPAVLVLRQHGRRLGLQAEALEGVRHLAAAQIRRLHHLPDPEELFDAVASDAAAPSAPIFLLEPGRLMDLLSIWVDDVAPTAAAVTDPGLDAAAAATGPGEPCALVRLGRRCLALPSACIGELMPMPALGSRWTGQGASLGVARWRGRSLAVLDLARLLGEAPRREPAAFAVVLDDGQGRGLILPVDELHGLGQVPAAAHETPADDGPQASPWLGARWLGDDGRECQRLSVEALLAALPEAALGRTDAGSADRSQGVADGHASRRHCNDQPYMVFAAGASFAAPVSDIQAVLPRPGAADGEAAGLLSWRGRTLPIGALEPAGASADGPLLMVVGQGEQLRAVPIDRLVALVPAQAGELSALPQAIGGRMLSVGATGASYRVLALGAALPA